MATTSNKGVNALGYRIFCLVFCVISMIGGVVAAFVIVCASHQSADMHCPLAGFVHSLPNDNKTGSSDATGEDTEEVTSLSSSSNSLRTEVTLRAVFGGVTVAWVGLVVAVCVWYNAVRCRNKSRVQDTSPASLLWARLMASADADSDDDDDNATRRRVNNNVVVRGGGNERRILFERLGPDFSRWAEPAVPPARLTTPRAAATTGATATTTTTTTTATTQAAVAAAVAAGTATTPPPTTAGAVFATTTTAMQSATTATATTATATTTTAAATTAPSTSMMSAGIAGVHNPTPSRNNNTSGRVVKSPTQPVFILVGDDESSTSGDSLLYV